MPKLNLTFELRSWSRSRQITDPAICFYYLSDAFVTDLRLRNRVGHLREVAHRLVHLAEIEKKDQQGARRDRSGEYEPHAVPEYETSPSRHDDFNDRCQFCF